MRIQVQTAYFILAIVVAICPSTIGQMTSAKNETLLDATSPFEDIAEFALAKDFDSVKKQLLVAEGNSTAVKAILSAENAKRYDSLMAALRKATTAQAEFNTASAAVDLFRLLIDALDATQLKVPKEVSLLDFVGFRIHVLTAAPKPDWDKIRKTVAEGADCWKSIEAKVTDAKLQAAVASTISGLLEAAKSENLAMINFAAQIDLDLVDLMESVFDQ